MEREQISRSYGELEAWTESGYIRRELQRPGADEEGQKLSVGGKVSVTWYRVPPASFSGGKA